MVLDILSHKQDFEKLQMPLNGIRHLRKPRYKDWVEHLQWDWCLSRQRF